MTIGTPIFIALCSTCFAIVISIGSQFFFVGRTQLRQSKLVFGRTRPMQEILVHPLVMIRFLTVIQTFETKRIESNRMPCFAMHALPPNPLEGKQASKQARGTFHPSIPSRTCMTWHWIALHCMALDCIALHDMALHCVASHGFGSRSIFAGPCSADAWWCSGSAETAARRFPCR